jgi:GABA(A) receptor-associated protein
MSLKYYDRVPVIIKPGNSHTPEIEKFKYLVPKHITVAEFVTSIRKLIRVRSYQALFIFVKDGVLPMGKSTMLEVYDENHDEDGFLYVTYSLENTFGHFSF